MSLQGTKLAARLEFMKFDQRSRDVLRELQPLIRGHMGKALDAFYDKMRATPEARTFFRDEKQIESAQTRQETHWNTLSDGTFDAAYEEKVLAVGRTHARIGLEPRWYIGGYAIISDHLIKAIVSDSASTLLKRLKSDPDALSEALSTLVKAMLLDMDLAITAYLETIDAERRKAETARAEAIEHQQQALEALSGSLAELACGNLMARLKTSLPQEFHELQSDFNTTVTKLQEVVGSAVTSMRSIESGNRELAQATDDLARRTEQQAASLEETTAALAQITEGVRNTTTGVEHARTVAATATKDAAHTSEIVVRSKSAMDDIQKATGQIGQITDVIDEIAFQTNLLALNAGVEAARAGESGRGFAVVATEVRSLAQRASQSAKDIKSLIDNATSTVAEGAGLVLSTEEALSRFVGQVQEINTIISSIADTAKEQTTGLNEVNMAVNDLDRATQQNAAMVEQSTAATQSLAEEAIRLSDKFSFFQTGQAEDVRKSSAPRAARREKTEAPALQQSAPPMPQREKKVVNSRMSLPAAASADDGWTEF